LTDIRLDTGFLDHPKTKRLKRVLGWEGIEALLRLWMFAADNKSRSKGNLKGMDSLAIADAANWDDDPDTFVKVLSASETRFLDIHQVGNNGSGCYYVLHDWRDHQGFVCRKKERSENAKNAAKKRWSEKKVAKKRRNPKPSKPIQVMPTACESHCQPHASRNAPLPSPSPTPTPSANAAKAASKKEVAKEDKTNPDKSPIPKIRELYRALWKEEHWIEMPWVYGKDDARLKRLMDQLEEANPGQGAAMLCRVIGDYIKSPNPFYKKVKHSMDVFVKYFAEILAERYGPRDPTGDRKAEDAYYAAKRRSGTNDEPEQINDILLEVTSGKEV